MTTINNSPDQSTEACAVDRSCADSGCGCSAPAGSESAATTSRKGLMAGLLALGLTLDEVVDALHATDQGDATCGSERWRLEAVLERIDAKIAELRAVRREVTKVMGACDRGACVFADADIGA